MSLTNGAIIKGQEKERQKEKEKGSSKKRKRKRKAKEFAWGSWYLALLNLIAVISGILYFEIGNLTNSLIVRTCNRKKIYGRLVDL